MTTPTASIPGTSQSHYRASLTPPSDDDGVLDNEARISKLKARLIYIEPLELRYLYRETLELLPHFKEEDIESLRNLVKNSSDMICEQMFLAKALGDRYIQFAEAHFGQTCFAFYKKAMNYYAKAIHLSKDDPQFLKKCHFCASKLYLLIIRELHGPHFKERLHDAKRHRDYEKFASLCKQVEKFADFCTSAADYQLIIVSAFYNQATDIIASMQDNEKSHYKDILQEIRHKQDMVFTPREFVTEKYSRHLAKVRALFKNLNAQNAYQFQKEFFDEYKKFFCLLLHDAFAIVGPPDEDWKYDIQSLGSLGCKSSCLFSDLELMVLISSEDNLTEAKAYFSQLLTVLELIVRCFGETQEDLSLFTCKVGFYMDSGPQVDDDLLATPLHMAGLQKKLVSFPASAVNMTLRSTSLFTNNPQLSEEFKTEQNKILDEEHGFTGISIRHWRALEFLQSRLQEYVETETHYDHEIVDIKKLFSEKIIYFLNDLALYFDIRESNAFDILDSSKLPFDGQSKILLKAAISVIYLLRNQFQRFYKEQKDVGAYTTSANPEFKHYAPIDAEMRERLQEFRFFILAPIYTHLKELFHPSKPPHVLKECFDKNFAGINLFALAFNKIPEYSHRHTQLKALRTFVFFLIKQKVRLETHISLYKQLSEQNDLEHLREAYLTTLRDAKAISTMVSLSQYPNPAGYRQIEQVHRGIIMHLLQDKEEHRGKNGFSADFKLPSSEKSFFLQPTILNSLFDEKGLFKKTTFSLEREGHCLRFDSQPQEVGKQVAANRLLLRLFGHGSPYHNLLKITVYIGSTKLEHFAMVSLIPGQEQNKKTITELFLAAVLLLPLNTKNSFIPPVTFQNKDKPRLHFNFSFELFHQFPNYLLDETVLNEFCLLNPRQLLSGWLDEMIAWDQSVAELNSSYCCLFDSQIGEQLVEQIQCLQAFLTRGHSSRIKCEELLQAVITVNNGNVREVGKILYDYYQSNQASPVTGSRTQNIREIHPKNIGQYRDLQYQPNLCAPRHLKELLDAPARTKPNPAILDHCDDKQITNKKLLDELKNKGAGITRLDLRECARVSDDFLERIAELCPNLTELFISGTRKLVYFEIKRFIVKNGPLYFPKLKILEISNCSYFYRISLIAPKLETFIARDNPRFRLMEIKSDTPPFYDFANSRFVERLSSPKKEDPLPPLLPAEKPITVDSFMHLLTNELLLSAPTIFEDITSLAKYSNDKQVLVSNIQDRVNVGIKKKLDDFALQSNMDPQSVRESFYQYLLGYASIPSTSTSSKPERRRTEFFHAEPVENSIGEIVVDSSIDVSLSEESQSAINTIFKIIEANKPSLKAIENKQAIIVIGNTGSGKSTLVNLLMGCKMISVMRKGIATINAIDPVTEIGHKKDSLTNLPAVFPLPESDFAICDVPGYLTTTGTAANIANAVNNLNLLSTARNCRVLLLFNYANIRADRGDAFKKLIETLMATFEDINEVSSSILLGITHLPDRNSVDIDYIKKRILKLARSKGWMINNAEQIIPIYPLENGAKEDVLKQVLSRTFVPQGIYKTSLNADDLLLIRQIAEDIEKVLFSQLDHWNLDGVLEHFDKLRSLRNLRHLCVDRIFEKLQQAILEKIKVLTQKVMLSVVQKNGRAKEQFTLLQSWNRLDSCFNEPNKISKIIASFQKEVLAAEIEQQKTTNVSIEQDWQRLNTNFALELEDILKRRRSELPLFGTISPEESLATFASHMPTVSSLKAIHDFLKEVDIELALRDQKYCFGDAVPLSFTRRQCEETVKAMIFAAQKQAKIEELKDSFRASYSNLCRKCQGLVNEHFATLSKSPITLKNFHTLSFPLVDNEVKQILSAKEQLSEFGEDVKAFCDVPLSNFLGNLHSEAVQQYNKVAVATAKDSIKRFLNAKSITNTDLAKCDRYFLELSRLNQGAYIEMSNYARLKLVTEPMNQLSHLLDGKHPKYKGLVKKIVNRTNQVISLPSCFKDSAQIVSEVKETVESAERKRRAAKLRELTEVFPIHLQEVKGILKSLAIKGCPALIAPTFNPNDLAFSLALLPETKAFRTIWQKIKNDVAAEPDHYLFIHDHETTMIIEKHEKELVSFLGYIHVYANVLSLQKALKKQIAQLIPIIEAIEPENFLKAKLSHPSVPKASVKEIERIKNALSEFSKKPNGSFEDVQELIADALQEFDLFLNGSMEQAKKRCAEDTYEALRQIWIKRDFLQTASTIRDLLNTLKRISEPSYTSAIKELSENIQAWLASNSHENLLAAGKYADFTKIYIEARMLRTALHGFFAIDITNIEKMFGNYIEQFFDDAKRELECDANEEDFFSIAGLKKFLEVLKTFQDILSDKGYANWKSNFQKIAMKRWKKVFHGLPNDLSTVPYEERAHYCTLLAKEMCKQYMVAQELGLTAHLISLLNLTIDRFLVSEENIYTFRLNYLTSVGKVNVHLQSAANFLVALLPRFKSFLISAYNEKARGVSFETALKGLRCYPSTSHNDHLEEAYAYFQKLNIDLLSLIQNQKYDSAQQLREIFRLADELKPYVLNLHHKLRSTSALLARLFARWTYLNRPSNSQLPNQNCLLQAHNTQILTIFRMIGIDDSKGMQNHLAEVKTGEGKSISLGILSALFGLLDYEVDVICYSDYLSKRDHQLFLKLFIELNVQSRIFYFPIHSLTHQLSGRCLQSNSSMVNSFLQKLPIKSTPSIPLEKTLLLIDEIDILYGEKFFGKLYNSSLTIPAEELFQKAWDNRKKYSSPTHAETALMRSKAMKKLLQEFPNLKTLIPYEIRRFVHELWKHRDEEYDFTQFVVKDNTLGKTDDAGNLRFHYCGYSIAFAYLAYYETKRIQHDHVNEHLKLAISCSSILYLKMIECYKLKCGLTATLEVLSKEEKEALEKFGFTKQSIIPSTFNKKAIEIRKMRVTCGSKTDFYDAIIRDIKRENAKKRPCFIMMKSTEDVLAFQNYLVHQAQGLPQPQILIASMTDDERATVIAKATSLGQITIMSGVFTRGIDFINYESIHVGGVHIVLAFQPKTLADEIQAFGRTCRQDNPGSVVKILFRDDLKHLSSDCPQADATQEEWVAFLQKLREDTTLEKFRKMNRTLEKNKPRHELSAQLPSYIEANNRQKTYETLARLGDYSEEEIAKIIGAQPSTST